MTILAASSSIAASALTASRAASLDASLASSSLAFLSLARSRCWSETTFAWATTSLSFISFSCCSRLFSFSLDANSCSAALDSAAAARAAAAWAIDSASIAAFSNFQFSSPISLRASLLKPLASCLARSPASTSTVACWIWGSVSMRIARDANSREDMVSLACASSGLTQTSRAVRQLPLSDVSRTLVRVDSR